MGIPSIGLWKLATGGREDPNDLLSACTMFVHSYGKRIGWIVSVDRYLVRKNNNKKKKKKKKKPNGNGVYTLRRYWLGGVYRPLFEVPNKLRT